MQRVLPNRLTIDRDRAPADRLGRRPRPTTIRRSSEQSFLIDARGIVMRSRSGAARVSPPADHLRRRDGESRRRASACTTLRNAGRARTHPAQRRQHALPGAATSISRKATASSSPTSSARENHLRPRSRSRQQLARLNRLLDRASEPIAIGNPDGESDRRAQYAGDVRRAATAEAGSRAADSRAAEDRRAPRRRRKSIATKRAPAPKASADARRELRSRSAKADVHAARRRAIPDAMPSKKPFR